MTTTKIYTIEFFDDGAWERVKFWSGSLRKERRDEIFDVISAKNPGVQYRKVILTKTVTTSLG